MLTLQEFRDNKSGQVLLHQLKTAGYTDIAIASRLEANSPAESRTDTRERAGHDPARRQPSSANSVLFAAKSPFSARRVDPTTTAGGPHLLEVSMHEMDLSLHCMHLPQKKAQFPWLQALLDLPTEMRSENHLLIGDINCGIPFEDSETRSFDATHLFQALLQQGWVDAWRSRNPSGREFSWVSSRSGNGFRYDHALASASLNQLIRDVRYDHNVRTDSWSDHSALLIETDL